MNTQLILVTILLTLPFAVALSGMIEWRLHAKRLHGFVGTEAHAYHQGHHNAHAAQEYKTPWPGEEYGLSLRTFVKSLCAQALVAVIVAVLFSNSAIFWTNIFVGLIYFKLIGVMHKRMHEPKEGGWIETTWFYRWLDKNHRIHHAQEDRCFTILMPFVDLFFGTHHTQKRASSE